MSHWPHLITLTELQGMQRFACACGEGAVGSERLIRALITQHRSEAIPGVRARILGILLTAGGTT